MNAGLAVFALTLAAGGAAMAAEHRVVIDRMAFTPQSIDARPGDVITWVNRDLFAHNVTGPGLRSGDLAPGQSWRTTVRAGTIIDYACSLHPRMHGQVRVLTVATRTAKEK